MYDQYSAIVPFLYSDEQIINMDEEKDTYKLSFRIGKYNNELIFAISEGMVSIIFDKCEIEGKNLIWKISKIIINY